MFGWLRGRGATPAHTARTAASIDPALWHATLGALPFLARLSADDTEALRARVAWLVASKQFSGTHGLEVTDAMRLSIAAQAALPILHLSPSLYEGWQEIVVYPGGFLIPRTDTDEAGVVHEYVQEAAGEAWDGGPVILSWEDVSAHPAEHGAYNVVIHEFAHKLDLAAGDADGIPAMLAASGISARQWRNTLDDAYDRYCEALEAVEAAIPRDVDPESEDADAWYGQLPLDPYAATDPAEFFAVSSEAFFVDPLPLAMALPDWYALLSRYYRQSPLPPEALVPPHP